MDCNNRKSTSSFEVLHEEGGGVVSIKPDDVHTNLLMIGIIAPGVTAQDFCDRLAQVSITTADAITLWTSISCKHLGEYEHGVFSIWIRIQ